MDEAQTRRMLIDRALRLAGWALDDPSQVSQELDIVLPADGTTTAEPQGHYGEEHQYADYALMLDGRPAAVVEAKRTSRDPQLGQEQALQYAQNVQRQHGGTTPLVFYTNGNETHFWEYDFYPPVKVYGFPTRDDLEWMRKRSQERRPLSQEMIRTSIADRDYQIAAIRGILEGVEKRQRQFLLVMATGTGKTRTAAALIDVLLRGHWAKRVLFLVDRIALRDQALDAFEEHIPSEPRWPHRKESAFVREGRRLYVATYPTMLGLIHAGSTPGRYISPFFFDVVIADESHRSIYNVYRQVLDYFCAVKIGLTATPRDHIDHDTYAAFECDTGMPTYAYNFDDAVAHQPPYLCNFEVLNVRSKFQLEGIHGQKLPPEIQQKLALEGKELDEIDFEGTDLERKVTNAGTNALIVREFMEESIKDQSGTLPGKSIVFAVSKGHARRLQALFDAMYPEHAGRLARVIVCDDPRVQGKGGLIDQFKNSDMPRVAISVDMLDTGVDVREVVNLVFAKPVYSYVKFWQMIGRGTRVLQSEPAKRKPWCTSKDRFLIVDCWGNFDYFGMRPAGREPNAQVPLPVRLFRARVDKLAAALAYPDPAATGRVVVDMRSELKALPSNDVVVMDNRAHLDTVKPDEYWVHLTDEKLGFLRMTVAPVLRSRRKVEFKELRFETDVVDLGTALLRGEKEQFDALRESVIEQVGELPLTIAEVAEKRGFIVEVLGDAWWVEPTDEKLCELVKQLAYLMRFRQSGRRAIMELSIQDLLAVKDHVEFGSDKRRMPAGQYREQLEQYVRSMVAGSPSVQKLLAGELLSDAEVRQLAEELAESELHANENILRRIYDNRRASFVAVLKHILDIEILPSWEVEVTLAFDTFIANHTELSAAQIRFLQTLKTFVIQNGVVRREQLVEAPFTRLHPQGVRGLFGGTQLNDIIELVESVTGAKAA